MVVFVQTSLCLGKSDCIPAKLLYSGKVVVLGQSGCIWAKVVVIGQNGCIQTKVVVIGKGGCTRAMWLYSGKSRFIRVKVVVFGQK